MISNLIPSDWDHHPDNPATETSALRARTKSLCPLCNNSKRCKTTERGAVLCHSYADAQPIAGWRFVRPLAKGMGGLWVPLLEKMSLPPRRPQLAKKNPVPALFTQPSWLTEATLAEWSGSAVNPMLTQANVRQHPQEGWLVAGVDLDTGLRQNWYQWKPRYKGFNPDLPKYLSPKGVPVEPLLLELPDELWRQIAQTSGLAITAEHQRLGFWAWVREHPAIPVVITEGAKKAGALLSHGYVAISIPGVSTCRKHGILHPWLAALAQGNRPMYLLFDNDIMTKAPVRAALSRLSGLLHRVGAQIRIIALPPGPAKGADDYLITAGPEALAQRVDEARTYQDWLVCDEDLPEGISVSVSSSRWMTLPDYADLPQVLLVKSPVGTGKTEALVNLVGAAPRVLVITHRQSLAWQLARRLDISCYLTGAYSSDKLVICADSLVNLNPSSYDLVILDESEQVLRHLCGATLRPRLDEVLRTFLGVIAQAKHLICLDAHLGQLTAQTFNRPGQTQLLINNYQPGGRHFLRHPSRQHLQARLFECLARGERVAYGANSRKEIEKLEEALGQSFPSKKLAVIHSHNLSDENQTFLNEINERLEGLDCLLYSPTIGTGVSIDVTHFDRVFLCGVAATTLPTDLLQQQGRVRHPNSGEVEYWIDSRYTQRPQCKTFYAQAYDLAAQWNALDVPTSDRQRWFTTLWNAVRTQEARGLVHLVELFEYYVQVDGHTIDDAQPLSTDSLAVAGERLRLSAQEIRQRRMLGIAAAQDLAPAQYRQLKELLEASGYLPLARHWELERYDLRSFYGQEVTLELIAQDRQGKLRREILALEIYLATDEELADRDHAERDIYREHRHYYRLQKILLRRLLEAAGLADLNQTQEFTRQSLHSFARLAKKYSRTIYACFHLTVPSTIELNPVQFLGTLLRRMGYRLCSKQKRVSHTQPVEITALPKKIDNRQRIYWLDPAASKQMGRWIDKRQDLEQQIQLANHLISSMAEIHGVPLGELTSCLGTQLGPLRATAEQWLERLSHTTEFWAWYRHTD